MDRDDCRASVNTGTRLQILWIFAVYRPAEQLTPVFFIIKQTRWTNFSNLFRNEILHVSGSSSAHHQEFTHCTLSNVNMSYRFVDSFRSGSGWNCSKAVYKPVWLISLNNFNAQFLYSLTICMLHYNPRHVSIFRRTNCIITASGIVTLCKRLYSMPDESRLQSSDDTICCDNTICPPEDGHVDARNM